MTAGEVRTALHNIQDVGPKGQYLVKIPNKVMGMVNRHSVESDMARVAMNMFLGVLIPVIRYVCTDLGSLIWNFDNFPAIQNLCEINFGSIQRVKNCHFNNFGGSES